MMLSTKKTVLGLSISAVLITACSPTQLATKMNSLGNTFNSSPEAPAQTKQDAQIARAMQASSNGLKSFPASPMRVANTNCEKHQINNNGAPEDAVKIRVTGYGAPPKSFYPDPQRRLMAMRAAKIDAYRSLAERVTGIQIWGGTTIGDMVVEKDRFRVYIDTYINGARVIAENPLDDGTFETIVEMTVDQNFLSKTLPEKVTGNCIQNVNSPSQKQAPALLYTASVGEMSNANFYLSK